jgi:alkaline phosphatase
LEHWQENNLPKNVILMIGDGMGLSQITGAMYSKRKGLQLERFENIGLQKTHCKDDLVTDSAAAATAIARGIKADKNSFGSNDKYTAPPTILEELKELGWATGIVVTSSISHATPAAFVSYQPLRAMYEEIAMDLSKAKVDYLVGGGKRYFDRRSVDDRNLIEEMRKDQVIVRSYLDGELADLAISPKSRFVYFTADLEPLSRSAGRTYFPVACERGLTYLQKRSDKGFFMMIEGSKIDVGGHNNVSEMVIDELLEFDEMIGKMLNFAQKNGETLVIVTADHETGGFAMVGEDEKGDPQISFVSKYHTATMIPVFAYGPGSENFTGVYDNTEIHRKVRQILKLKEPRR